MKTKQFDLPTLYGDHHVIEVRRILMEIPGVDEVYASSSFQAVEIQYDENKVKDTEIQGILGEAGYMGELMAQSESEKAESRGENTEIFLRHTSAYSQTKLTVGFSQSINQNQGRPLWPCPGIGLIKTEKEME